MILFWTMWGVDAAAALVVLYFFIEGMGDHTVSERNAGLWMMILGILAVVLLGSIWLRNHHYPVAGNLLLLVIFIPAMLYLLYLIVAVFSGGRWN